MGEDSGPVPGITGGKNNEPSYQPINDQHIPTYQSHPQLGTVVKEVTASSQL